MTLFIKNLKGNDKVLKEIYSRRNFQTLSNLGSNFGDFQNDFKWHIQGCCDICLGETNIFERKLHNWACVTSPSPGNQVDALPSGLSLRCRFWRKILILDIKTPVCMKRTSKLTTLAHEKKIWCEALFSIFLKILKSDAFCKSDAQTNLSTENIKIICSVETCKSNDP